MKKLSILLFLCIYSLSFTEWYTQNIKDRWHEDTGQTVIFSNVNEFYFTPENQFINMDSKSIQVILSKVYYKEQMAKAFNKKKDDILYVLLIDLGAHLKNEKVTNILMAANSQNIIEIKIDNNNPIKLIGICNPNTFIITIPLLTDEKNKNNSELLISQMKKGKKFNISLNRIFLLKTDLNKFNERFNKLSVGPYDLEQ